MKSSVLETIQGRLRHALTANMWLKVLALVITVLVYALVRGGQEVTTRLLVDVDVLTPGLTSSRVLITEPPELVKLHVRGSPRLIQMVSGEEIPPVKIDLRNADDGQYVLDASIFQVPPGLKIVAITPNSLDLRYEPRITRYLNVRPDISGTVAEGYHIREPIRATPAGVVLSGARRTLEEQVDLETVPIPVHGLGRGKHRRVVDLEPPPPHANYEGVESVSVLIEVEPDVIERELSGIQVQVRGATLPAQAEPVTMLLEGPPNEVNAIRVEDIVVYVEMGEDGAEPGAHRREVVVSPINPAVKVRLIPAAVIVDVSTAAHGPLEAPPSVPPPDGRGKAPPNAR